MKTYIVIVEVTSDTYPENMLWENVIPGSFDGTVKLVSSKENRRKKKVITTRSPRALYP